ncbi:Adenosylcobinamide-phosphate synthase [Micromonospora saelicesensis]|nr:Adenosylcobinamide-phosphate synthase [Micromonospora saelicesensis]
MAGAFGVRLGGRNVDLGRSEVRPFLGDGPGPEARHLKRAARISGAVGLAAVGLAAAYPLTLGRLVGAASRRALIGAVGRRRPADAVGGRGLAGVAGGVGVRRGSGR